MTEIAIRFTADGRAVVAAARDAEAALQGISTQAGRTNATLQSVQNASAGVSASFASIGKAGMAFGIASDAARGLLSAIQSLPASGIKFAASLEVSKVGMAGILASMTAMDGKTTSYAQGMELASGITQRLQKEAMMTAATTQELVGAFQALLGPGLAAGMKVQEIEKLTSTGVNAVKSMGLASNQVVQELRDLVQGGITASSSTLATALGLKDADIARAKASSEGLYKFLMERLKGFAAAGPAYAQTFTGTMDLLSERVKMTAAVMFAPLADAMKEQAAGIGDALNNDQNVAGLTKISGAVASVATGLGTATRFAIEHSGAIAAVGQAYAAIKFGAMVAGWVASAQAMTAASAASRLQAAQSAAEALANTEVTLTTQQKLAAYIAELAAKQASAQATVAETTGRIAFLETSLAMIAISREEVVAKMAATRSTMAQAEAQLSAARAAGAQSFALALVTEATATLSAAQIAQAALVTELAVLGRQQAGVHAATAAAIGAQAAATESAALASAQLAAAQRAASASTSAMGSVIGALGGPVGIAIAAIGLLIMQLASLRREGQAAALDAQSLERIKAANAAGKKAESRDLNKIPSQVEALKSQADQLELDIKNNDPWAINGKIERERLARYQTELAKVRQRTKELTDVAAAAEAITQKSEASLQINAMGSTKALDALLGKQKTVSAARDEAKLEASALDTQLAALKSNKSTTPEQAADYEKRVAEAKKAIAVKLQSELKGISQKGQAGVTAAYNDGVNAQIETLKKSQALQVQITSRTVSQLASEHKRGLLTEDEYINKVADAEKKALTFAVTTAEAELALAAKKTKNKKELATLEGSVAQAREKLADRELDRGNALLELQEKIDTERRQFHASAINASMGELDALAEKNKATRLEIEAIGLTNSELDKLTRARIDDTIAAQQQKIAVMQVFDGTNDAVQLEVDKLAQMQEARALLARKSAAEDLKKLYDNVQQGLTDAIMNGGKSGAENLKNLFKTMVLRPIISGVMSPIAGAVSSVVNSGLGAIGLGSGGVGTSALGSLVSSALGSITLGGSTISAIGSSVATGVSAGLAGTSLAGASAAYGAAGMSGVASGLSVGSSIGTTLAAIPGWGWAALGVAAVGAAALGGKKDSRYGAAYDYTQADGTKVVGGPNAGVDFAGKSTAADLTVQGINAMLERLGSAEKINRFSSGFESSEKGKGFSFAGGELTNGTIFGQGVGGLGWQNNRGSKTAEQAMAEYQTELQQATLQALQSATDVPKLISSKLDGIDIDALTGSALTQLISTVNTQIMAVEQFRASILLLPFSNLKDLSFGAAAALIEVAGGVDALNTKLTSYFDNFYTAEEKRAQVIKTINIATAGSGLDAAVATRESFRSLVESQDLTTDAGQKTYAALISVAGAFAGITPAADAAVQAVAGVSDALKKLQGDTANLQIELMRAQGNTAGADAAQYTIDTTGMTEAERAIFDYNRALRAQITALTEASAAAEKTNAAIRSNAKSGIESAVAAFEKSKSNTSDALAALEKSINAEKTRITVIRDVAAESVRSITGIFSALDEQIKQLYGTVSSTSAMQASQGNDYINKALSAALSTGYLPDAKALSDAISAARTGLGQDKFSSKFEADKASLVLAGKLTQLQTASGKQLTEAERQLQVSNDQLAALDKSLEMYKQQVDALNRINTSVLSVADSVSGLLGAMQAQAAAKEAVQAAQAQGAASLYASNPHAVKNPGQEGLDFWQGQIASKGYDAAATDFDASVTYVNDTVKSWYAGNPDAVKNPDSGAVQYWLDQIDAIGADAAKAKFAGVVGSMTGNAPRPLNSFAVGINRVPFDMTAEIHKDEAIVPAVFNPFNPSALKGTSASGDTGDTSELLAEIRRLNARLARIEAHVASTSKNTERSALVLDDASRGKRPLKTEVAA